MKWYADDFYLPANGWDRRPDGKLARFCKGGSSSQANTSTTTNNVDQRQVADNGASNVNIGGNGNNSITLTDNGAVKAAMDTINAAGEKAVETYNHLLDVTAQLEQGNRTLTQSNLDFASKVAAQPVNATDDRKILIYAGMAVVALAAVVTMGKK